MSTLSGVKLNQNVLMSLSFSLSISIYLSSCATHYMSSAPYLSTTLGCAPQDVSRFIAICCSLHHYSTRNVITCLSLSILLSLSRSRVESP
jgi:hypothetical protein